MATNQYTRTSAIPSSTGFNISSKTNVVNKMYATMQLMSGHYLKIIRNALILRFGKWYALRD